MITPAQLVSDFAEFGNSTNYPPTTIQFWLNLAYLRLNAIRWGDLLDVGAELYVCHNLVMERNNVRAASRGATSGAQKGPISSVGVGPASESFDAGVASEQGWGNYNATNYGVRFAELASLVGAGPVQV